MDLEVVQEISGWIGFGLTILYYLAPIPTFFEVLKGKMNFEETPGFFVSSCYLNSFLWFIYGQLTFSAQVKYSHLIGACVSLCLMSIYILGEIQKYLIDSILNSLIVIIGTWAIYRILVLVYEESRIAGKFCLLTSCFMYIYPMIILFRVLKEKNYKLITINSACIYLFSSIAWIIYGLLAFDDYLILPYSIGIAISCLQIIVYLIYRTKYPLIGTKDFFPSTVGIESNENEENKKEEAHIKIDDEDTLPKIKERPVKIISNN